MTITYTFSATNSLFRQAMGFLLFFCIVNISSSTDYRQLANLAQERYGAQAQKKVFALEALLIQLAPASEVDQLKRINQFFNDNILFVSDKDNWGEEDYWATPLEALGTGQGDCEDYSIAKYIFLRALGIPDSRLKLTYVRARVGGRLSSTFQTHMVLSYYVTPTAEPMILDNLLSEIHSSSRRTDLMPIFSFNSKGLWAGANPKASSINSLSRWRNVLTRIQNDGIH